MTQTLVVVAAVALLFGGGFFAGRATAPESAQAAGPASGEARATTGPLGEQTRRQADDPFAIGDIDAPVAMVIFSDYRCPFCARYSTVTEPELIEKYVDEGILRIEWRDFPVFGDASMLAARAGRAAAAQGLFWEFNDAVYEAAPQNAHHDLTPDRLLGFAAQVGVPDLKKFEEEMSGGQYDGAIMLDSNQARLLGISGTPSFIVDGHPVVGAQPTELFVEVIEHALAAKTP